MTTGHTSSFAFLAPYGPLYLQLATVAESALALDPSLTLLKLRQLAEAFAQRAASAAGLAEVGRDTNQHDLLRMLEQRGIVTDHIAEVFHMLRRAGNRAAHDFVGTHQDALNALRIAHDLAGWFHRTFGDKHARSAWKASPYVPPPDPAARLRSLEEAAASTRTEAEVHKYDVRKALKQLEAEEARRVTAEAERKEWEELAHAFERDLNAAMAEQAKLIAAVATDAAKAPEVAEQAVVARATAATKATELDERSTRILIDGQLRDAGWEVDSEVLTWTSGARPEKGKNRAIAEVPTATAEDGAGIADYVLFLGTTPCAVVEAKRKAKKIPSVLEQSKRYARGLTLPVDAANRAGEGAEPGWPSGFQDRAPRYRVPFLYATNGRPYLRQLETESGVWFQDVRRPNNHPRALLGWHTPEALAAMLAHDPAASDLKLRDKPADVIQQALGLRDYQIRAIHAVEQAIAGGQRSLLVAMATGTGKTRTVIGLIHRLLESQRFRRVLFLVDRSALGLQALGAFNEVRLENLQTFAQNYNIKGLEDVAPAKETQVHIATVQGMVQRVLNGPSDEPPIPIDRYDCIIVDESHRGYTLDRDMTEGEQELRSFEDYVSAYRRVLDHFDAVKIGLTATPAQHTREIFGDPVFVYAYPEAVADGFLVDHEPPLQITTQLAKHGIKFEKGAEVETLLGDGEIQLSLLPDEMNFEVASFNRTVITDGFNRAVAEELAQHLDPFGEEKTLIFCVDDDHAERLVPILKAELARAWGDIEDDTVKKITGAIDRPGDAILRFKNEANPRIAVTVDLLSTGIDVPKICNIVFLRRIRSRILYDQMLGRATRLCPEIGKAVFRIYDAVGLYDTLAPVSEMKPLVKDVTRTTADLIAELLDPRSLTAPGDQPGRSHADHVLQEVVERLRRAVRKLGKRGAAAALQDTIESAEARIRAERRRRWEEGLRAKGKDPAKASYEVARTEPTEEPSTLPATWSWTRADEVVAPGTIITYGIVLPGKHVEGGVPYIRQQDIRDGRIDGDALLRTTPEIAGKHDRSTLQAGDVLLCIIRHRRVAIVPAGLDGANITQGTVRFRPCDEIESAYLAAWLESPVAQQWMEARVFGLDMPRINVSDTREIPIPLPPREEQLRIVQLLAVAMARLAAIGDAQANAVTRAVALEQATLAKAFRGELVPQDPNDEPAAALLERIRAARAAESTAPRRSRSIGAKERASITAEPTNGHSAVRGDEPLDLVIAAFQRDERRLGATQIADATGLDAAAVKRALATLVDSGQVRVHGRARGTSYEWSS